MNKKVDSLDLVASTCKPPIAITLRHVVEMICKPSIPNNNNNWKVFENN